MKEDRDHRPRWLVNYSFSNIHFEILPISDLYAMKYGRALERLIREVVIADPALGSVHVLKEDNRDGFYRIVLHPTDAPKLGLVFPLEVEYKNLVVIPLTLPMGWKHFPPILCK